MKAYFDSSALVKVFTDEIDHDRAADIYQASSAVLTTRLAYVECVSAFARAERSGRGSAGATMRTTRQLDERWPDFSVIDLDDALMRGAATLVRSEGLRAADAIHLAAALSASPLRFVCWDKRLASAARRAGLHVDPAP